MSTIRRHTVLRVAFAAVFLVMAASGSACEGYKGGGCAACRAMAPFCNYCPLDNKCSNSNLKKYCHCTAANCIGQDCATKTCAPPPPPAPPAPPAHVKNFTITVQEIADALNHTHIGHPLENLIIKKILAIFQQDHMSIAGQDIVYDNSGHSDTIILKNSSCKVHIQLDGGWTTHAVLKGPSAVNVEAIPIF